MSGTTTKSVAHGPRLTAIDLFAGAGGLTTGLRQAGFNVLAAVELDARAAETFRANHQRVHIERQDIRDVDARKLMKRLELVKGELDLLAGCPPCQGFSRLTLRNGAVQDSDERNDLVFDFVRFACVFRPKALMFENVPGLVRDGRFAQVRDALQALGYSVNARVLDANEYGVPQRRNRLIVLGAMRNVRLVNARPLKKRLTVRDAFTPLASPGTSGDQIHDLPVRHADHVLRLIRSVPKDGGSRSQLPATMRLACHQRTAGFHDVYGRMSWDSPSPTITSGCVNPSKGRFLHPVEDRAITLREAALLQGFPPAYVFIPSHGKEAIAAMIGNALPPPFIAAHARAIRRALCASRKESRSRDPIRRSP